MSGDLAAQVLARLASIYPSIDVDSRAEIAHQIFEAMGLDTTTSAPVGSALPSEDEVMLITYGDTFTGRAGQSGFSALSEVLDRFFDDVFPSVHVLPFFESSGDGGFSIVDYRQTSATVGTWGELAKAVENRELMVDLVCNHGSARSEWFQQFQRDELPGRDFYKTASPDADVSLVVRPRTHPLLLQVETPRGVRHVWATFSHDQVDFDFANPDVLVEFCSIIALYLRAGATRVRLDAIAYLWKQVGTTCVHLPQTHEIVKLLRTLTTAHTADALVITETNVPHDENMAYFGDGDEAHVVYNFTLAPLLVSSVISQDAQPLTDWLGELVPPPQGCTFLNFIASHDGIGLRPIEDRVDEHQLDMLLEAARAVGGDWSAYQSPDGPRPYELNVSLTDLLAGIDGEQEGRFLVAHAAMLAVQGVPAVYVHSIVASPGDHAAVRATGHLRDINRAQLTLTDVDDRLSTGWRASLSQALCHLIRVRREQPAFAPTAEQRIHHLHSSVVAIERRCPEQQLIALHNLSDRTVHVEVPEHAGRIDLVTGTEVRATDRSIELTPWQALWLS